MARNSFSNETKEYLNKTEPKKKCCRRVLSNTIAALSSQSDSPLLDLKDVKCDNCRHEFLKGAFISKGNLTDPQKRYHLEYSLSNENERDLIKNELINAGFTPGEAVRKGKYILYFKDSDTISDLLAYLGATNTAFEIMNSKIVKEIRNNANRLVNCDTANIEKAINASQKYVEAIEYLRQCGGIEELPAELRETADLRINNIQASIAELASKTTPPISKSGMKHRLEKILSHAEDLKRKNSIT